MGMINMKCFKTAFEESDDSDDAPVERRLLTESDDKMKLEFVVHLKVFASTWSPSYSLALSSVVVEKIDMLESRVFDVEQAIERVNLVGKETVVTELHVQTASSLNSPVAWDKVNSKTFEVVNKTSICSLVAGVYMVAMSISFTATSYNCVYALLKDGETVFQSSAPYNQGSGLMIAGSWILELKKGENLSVIGYGHGIQIGSKLVLTKIGG